MLKTCRRVRDEIGGSWLGQVLFNFETCEEMMVKFMALPAATLSKIRHLRARIASFDVDPICTNPYYLPDLLKRLPGLQLDTLTVLNRHGIDVPAGCGRLRNIVALHGFIGCGQGWKELRFISHHSSLRDLVDEVSKDQYQRDPQPAGWIDEMNSRDGVESQPSVTVYQYARAGVTCPVISEATRVPPTQTPPEAGEAAAAAAASAAQENAPITPRKEEPKVAKDLAVVVKRGKGVDHRQRKQPPVPPPPEAGDVGMEQSPPRRWAQIRLDFFECRICAEELYSGDEDDRFLLANRLPRRVDVYKHVDEYEWVPKGREDSGSEA